jgi:hypothetical protein
MKNEVYIGRESQSVIEVYDITTLRSRRSMSISRLLGVYDMTSCPQCDVVYIIDWRADKTFAINEHGLVVFSWSVYETPLGMSVYSRLYVVVSFFRRLQVFTRRGELVRNVSLQSGIIHVQQAIQLDDDRYIVVQSSPLKTSPHRVCIVNGNGTIIGLQSYGGSQGSGIGQLNWPIRMLIFGGSLIVADRFNHRVLLFNVSPLTYVRELILTRDSGSQPYRLAISDDGTRLFVSYANRELRTFNVTWI